MPPPRSKRGVGYIQAEVDSLLDLLYEHVPISSGEWTRVVDLQRCNFPAEDRNLA